MIEIISVVIFAIALIHTSSAKLLILLADRYPRHGGPMVANFGWNAALAVVVNATAIIFLLRSYIGDGDMQCAAPQAIAIPALVNAIYLVLLTGVVAFAHHPVLFLGLFLFFLGFAQAYDKFQIPLILKEGLLVGFFLAGLVVLGGMQQ